MRSFLLALASIAGLALSAPAQTVHDIAVGPGFSFVPASISIAVGDTVKWTWVGGVHDLESGSGGVPDGNFGSGVPTGVPGTTYQVVFDQAYLDAHPMPAFTYPFYCAIHVSFGMQGQIAVQVPGSTAIYGCGFNPPGSLFVASGAPNLGAGFTVAIHNPLGTQSPGSLALLAVSSLPAPGFPCGIVLPGFGMSGPGSLGELLLDVTPGVLAEPILGPLVWTGSPADFALTVPNDVSLAGATLYFQGGMVDLAGPVVLAFTQGMQVSIGTL